MDGEKKRIVPTSFALICESEPPHGKKQQSAKLISAFVVATSVTVQPCLCQIWSEPQIVGFYMLK